MARETDSRIQSDKTSSVVLPASGTVDREEFRDEFEITNSIKAATNEAFFEEILEVRIHDTDNPHAEKIINVGVNGVNQFFIRGQTQRVKRKFVELLALAKTENISTRETRDANGNLTAAIDRTRGLRYPFSVLRDPNPEGHAWLQNVLNA